MGKMMLGFLAALSVTAVLATPLSAQSMSLEVSIPFQFAVGGKTMPAGVYMVSKESLAPMVLVRSVDQHASVSVISSVLDAGYTDRPREPELVFNRYGNTYFMSQIWDSQHVGHEIRVPRSERVNRASSDEHQTVTVLAMR
jgi:hypothetical protein